MSTQRTFTILLSLVLFVGCGDDDVQNDASMQDAATQSDVGAMVDAGSLDSGADAGFMDFATRLTALFESDDVNECTCSVAAGDYPDVPTCRTALADDQEAVYLRCLVTAYEANVGEQAGIHCTLDALLAQNACVEAAGCDGDDEEACGEVADTAIEACASTTMFDAAEAVCD